MTPYEYGILTGWLMGVGSCVLFDMLRTRRQSRDDLETRVKAIEDYLKPLQDYGKGASR